MDMAPKPDSNPRDHRTGAVPTCPKSKQRPRLTSPHAAPYRPDTPLPRPGTTLTSKCYQGSLPLLPAHCVLRSPALHRPLPSRPRKHVSTVTDRLHHTFLFSHVHEPRVGMLPRPQGEEMIKTKTFVFN